jgi:hypothetical protein
MAMMTAEEAAEWGKTLSFEKVWAMFAETDRKMKESSAEVDRKFAEVAAQAAETERIMKETERITAKTSMEIAEICKRIDRVTKNVGGLNRSMGELIETLISARLWEKFPQYGFVRAYRRLPIYDEANRVRTDIDILLSNTDKVMAVEVKHELNRKDDVDGHIKRMKLIREYPPPEVENKQLFGAMAGSNVDVDVKDYAYGSGFYVLEMTGESVSLIPPPPGFSPGQW